jgi:hypothetical protein
MLGGMTRGRAVRLVCPPHRSRTVSRPMALRTLAHLTIVSVLALAACGAEQSPEQLVTKQIAVTQEFGQVLAKITDRASAKQHKSEVKSLVKQINALRKDIQELPEDVRKVCFELAAERGPELQSALAKMRSELTRIEPSAEIQGVIGLWLDML